MRRPTPREEPMPLTWHQCQETMITWHYQSWQGGQRQWQAGRCRVCHRILEARADEVLRDVYTGDAVEPIQTTLEPSE